MVAVAEPEADLLPVEEVVPTRSVLTELARGFLLTRDRDPGRAARFATTFLKERHPDPSPGVSADPEPSEPLTTAHRLLGCLPRGAVERPSLLRPRPA